MNIRYSVVLALWLISGARVLAQEQSPATSQNPVNTSTSTSSSRQDGALPEAPSVQPNLPTGYQGHPSDSYLYYVGAFCGSGASTSPVSTTPTLGCGTGFTIVPLPIFFEAGVMALEANRSHLTGYISLDGSIPLAHPSSKYLPLAIVGYSRLFETGHALDYGLALALPRPGKIKDNSKSLRIELRDYYTFASPTQHNIMLRIGWMSEEADD